MENFNKNSLKAAVKVYGPLHSAGKAETEVKEALASDEKGYTPEQIDEIYKAIAMPEENDEPKGELLTAETPEWVEQLLASNQALLESNQSVVNAVAEFKEAAVDFLKSGGYGHDKQQAKKSEPFDKEADYEVAEGKSFRDYKDFTKEYTSGQDVSHLPVEVLERLHANGLITEA
ncbi:hypothetical protein [Mucilaginibacter endophyticus]|uniref:hypothetical protein n=1 Tax=Mucilaginibacter endophyticus TaxID=2675003 RepID=UPI000E0DA5AB|nr:hypothetical protein [Mucilaginibacter endophyticus]